jgi:hypothetical protein
VGKPVKLASIAERVKGMLSIDDDAVAKLEALYNGTFELGGTIDQTINVPIHNGHGEYTDSQATFFVTLRGTFELLSPPGGTWRIQAFDGATQIADFQNVVVGQPQPFEYTTGLTLSLRVVADWSELQDTTLQIRLRAQY